MTLFVDKFHTEEEYVWLIMHLYIKKMNTKTDNGYVLCLFAGLVFAVGGHNGSKHLGSGETFDPLTAKWKKIASMVTQKTGV